MSRIMVVDDEPAICWGLREFLSDQEHDVQVASSAEQAWKVLDDFRPETIVLDVRLPGTDGLTAIAEFHRRLGPVPVIVMTAFGELETAVRAVQQGAFEYLTKPFDLDQAGTVIERALQWRAPAPEERAGAPPTLPALIGSSPPMQAVFKQIALVAATEVPVLITGETGTGKELVAQAIHRHGRRPQGPFVPVCLAALSPSVLESELFGHTRGAFTGAVDDRPGLIELAEGGTLFLDEMGDTPPEVQVKLLRFLETRQFARVGSGTLRSADVRVVAATNRNLPQLIEQGKFRDDLFFRLRGFQIELPPLRDRSTDIPLLAEAFWAQACPQRATTKLTPEFLAALQRRQWLGNVRELRFAVEHAAILARSGPLHVAHLPPELPAPGSTPATAPHADWRPLIERWIAPYLLEAAADDAERDLYRRLLDAVEPALFRAVLEHTGDNRAAAARLLGLDRSTLRTKLRAHGLD